MTELTIKALADEIQTSVDYLVKQFADAGILKSAEDKVTKQQKQALLIHLNRKYSSDSDKLTLKRKTRSTLKITSSSGNRSIQIEIRKKHTFARQDVQELEQCSAVEQVKHESEDKINSIEDKTETRKDTCETSEKTRRENSKKDRICNQKTDAMIKNLQKENTLRENKVAEIKRKAEEEAHRKLEQEVQHAAKEALRLAQESEKNWNNIADSIEDRYDYHLTTSQHARHAEDENDRAEESSRSRSRFAKTTRLKKSNRHSESKSDREEARAHLRGVKKKKSKDSSLQQSFRKPSHIISRDVVIGEGITVSELANKMAIKSSQVIKVMIKHGFMATINQLIDQETAQLVAEEMGHRVILRRENELEESIINDRDTDNKAESRAPVVTIMGHVDHGKTSLLDCIRSTKLASGEAGGITQYIGAYRVETKKGQITFLDTPGHAAFTAMRARGAKITDIIVLVVAADDGVMPQTVEAIQHAKEVKVPMVVAINKIDKPESDLNRVRSELSKYNLIPDEWGGDCQFVYVSAKANTGINELLNAILLQSEMLELKAIHKGMAKGLVIESFLDKSRGPVATILVREGTLNKGDIVLCGSEYGRVRSMRDEFGREIIEAGPSIPVEVLGLSGVPVAGDEIAVVRDEKKAREVALYRQAKFREEKLAYQKKSKSDKIFTNVSEKELHEVNILLKANAQGVIEAISNSLLELSNNEVKIKIISSGVGRITETDAILAATSKAIIFGFNVRADVSARAIIESENLDLRYFSIIYNLIDAVKAEIINISSHKLKQRIIGLAEIRDVFKSRKFGTIAGCIVLQGSIKRHNPIRILRDNMIIYEGELGSLRRFKDDVNEVHNGAECGIGIKNYHDMCEGDKIEAFEISQTLNNVN